MWQRWLQAYWCFLFITSEVVSIVESLSNRLLVIGLGRVGLKVASEALVGNFFSHVSGTVRHLDDDSHRLDATLTTDNTLTLPQNTMNGDKIEKILFQELSPSVVQSSSHILFTIPAPDEAAWHVIKSVIVPALATTTFSASKWVGILSTTGVYGNHDGAWVTEESECLSDRCSSAAGQLLHFEMFWRDHPSLLSQTNPGARVRVFRCAGIYGNTRSALHAVYQRGLPVLDKSQDTVAVTNRIHEDDLVAAIMSCMMCEADSTTTNFEIYNVADNLPESRRVVMEYAAGLLRDYGVDVAISRSPSLEPSKREKRRETDRKLVSNEKLRSSLLPSLMYPTYKEGLVAILHYPEAPWHQRNLQQ